MFEKMKRLWAANNSIKKVDLNLAALDLLDLSGNGLFEIPDLSGCPNLKELDLQKNKARGLWTGILDCPKLEKLNLQKNKFKWDSEQFAACLGIQQAWTGLKELNLAGNKVLKIEGYRFYMATFSPSLTMLDGVDTVGDADPSKEPVTGSLLPKVKPLHEVKRKYAMMKKLMQDPELMAKAAAAAEALDAEEAEDEDEEGVEKVKEVEYVEEEKDEEDPSGSVRVLISDLTRQLTRCFEGSRIAQQVCKKLDGACDKIMDSPMDNRILFTKGQDSSEVIEEFVQTIVVVLEKDTSLIEPGLTIMTKMLTIINEGIGKRILIQLKDLLQSSASMGDVGGGLLIDIIFARVEEQNTPEDERQQLLEALYEIAHPEVAANIHIILKSLIDGLKAAGDEPPEYLLGLFVQIVEGDVDDTVVQIFRKEKVSKIIIDLLNFFKSKLGRESAQEKEMYSKVLSIIAGMAASDEELASNFVRSNVHMTLLDQMNKKLQDSAALMYEATWISIGQVVSAISGLCKDRGAMDQAIAKGFLNQLTVCLSQEELPPKLISTAYRSLLLMLTFAVPDPLEDQIPDTIVKKFERENAYNALIREHAVRIVPELTEDEEIDISEEPWMIKRKQINEVLEGVIPLL